MEDHEILNILHHWMAEQLNSLKNWMDSKLKKEENE
jgi:hypothetical protein